MNTQSMPMVPEQVGDVSLSDQLLLIIIFFVLILLCITLTFVISSIILRLVYTARDARYRQLEKEWQPILLHILAGDEKKENLIQCIRAADSIYFVTFLFECAKRFVGQERQLLNEMAQPFLMEIAKQTRKGGPEGRAHALLMLSSLGFEHYVEDIIVALDDSSILVAMTAARALAKGKQTQYVEAILQRLHRFHTWDQNFLSALLAHAGPWACPALRDALADSDQAIDVRVIAADTLKRLNDLAAADIGVHILETEPDKPELISAILKLLSGIGHAKHLAPIRHLCHAPQFFIRAHAVSTLGKLGDKEAQSILLQAFEDPSPWVAYHAAKGIKDVGGISLLKKIIASGHSRADIARQVLVETGY